MNILLWIIQVLLGLLFIFGGASKLVMSIDDMTKQMSVAMPGLFMRFIGVCEVLGGLGLILPGLLRIKPWLTPLAAACLTIITIGATVVTLIGKPAASIFPLVACLLCAFVAYGRWRLAPLRGR
jgi:uncharacterized membrane protein YphA (DoxX/SURF4 family)